MGRENKFKLIFSFTLGPSYITKRRHRCFDGKVFNSEANHANIPRLSIGYTLRSFSNNTTVRLLINFKIYTQTNFDISHQSINNEYGVTVAVLFNVPPSAVHKYQIDMISKLYMEFGLTLVTMISNHLHSTRIKSLM